ncbi:hypothetical protein HDU98_008609 [Podochytrium sp. JEL0797]|nr:hypothetical protein HDU98_008609 [Podochytrium sp. JEL0797]
MDLQAQLAMARRIADTHAANSTLLVGRIAALEAEQAALRTRLAQLQESSTGVLQPRAPDPAHPQPRSDNNPTHAALHARITALENSLARARAKPIISRASDSPAEPNPTVRRFKFRDFNDEEEVNFDRTRALTEKITPKKRMIVEDSDSSEIDESRSSSGSSSSDESEDSDDSFSSIPRKRQRVVERTRPKPIYDETSASQSDEEMPEENIEEEDEILEEASVPPPISKPLDTKPNVPWPTLVRSRLDPTFKADPFSTRYCCIKQTAFRFRDEHSLDKKNRGAFLVPVELHDEFVDSIRNAFKQWAEKEAGAGLSEMDPPAVGFDHERALCREKKHDDANVDTRKVEPNMGSPSRFREMDSEETLVDINVKDEVSHGVEQGAAVGARGEILVDVENEEYVPVKSIMMPEFNNLCQDDQCAIEDAVRFWLEEQLGGDALEHCTPIIASLTALLRSDSNKEAKPKKGAASPSQGSTSFTPNIQDYEIISDIGGVGDVSYLYLAKFIPTSELVALQYTDLKLSQDYEFEEQAYNTIKNSRLCSHKNILPYFTSFIETERLWTVTLPVATGSCRGLLRSHFPQGFDSCTVATILKEVLNAIVYFHENRMIHNDLRPDNILVDMKGNVFVTNLRQLVSLTQDGEYIQNAFSHLGDNIEWAAPEIMAQHSNFNEKVDLYSFGITALELAYGATPFDNWSPLKILLSKLEYDCPGIPQPPPPPPTAATTAHGTASKEPMPTSFLRLVKACIRKNPKERPTAKELLLHPFFSYAKPTEYLYTSIVQHVQQNPKKPMMGSKDQLNG